MDFSFMGPMLFAGLWAMIMFGFIQMFFHPGLFPATRKAQAPCTQTVCPSLQTNCCRRLCDATGSIFYMPHLSG